MEIHSRLLSKIKQNFNDISFMSLIFVWFIVLILSSINEESHKIKEIILTEELNMQSQAFNYFNWKDQNKENILSFAKKIENVQTIIVLDENWKIIFSMPENEIENVHASPYSANIIDTKSGYDNIKWQLLTLNFINWEKIVVSKQLSDQYKNEIIVKHFSTVLITIFVISAVYMSYNLFFIKKLSLS